jgi:hypothetical protein
MKLTGFFVLLLSIALVGCGGGSSGTPLPPPKPKPDKHEDDDHHDHGEGPHGGVIIEFGKYHGEFTVSHPNKEVTIYILSGNLKKAVPIDSKKLLLSIKEPKFQVDLLPSPLPEEKDGKSSRFTAKDDRFGKEQAFEGTLSGNVEGKEYSGDFKAEPEGKEKKK